MSSRPAAPKGARAAGLPRLRRHQRGGFALGLIVGMLIGLALSLAVALYVTNVPVPFINKVPQRSAEQEASQLEKNRNWEPNAPLSGKGAQRAQGAASTAAAPPAVTPPPSPVAVAPAATPAPATKPAASSAAEAITYFVQAGAFLNSDDAEQQRASLALLGLTAKITEREQAGRMMYRVRVGPFERKADADAAKERLSGAGIEAALVRVQQR